MKMSNFERGIKVKYRVYGDFENNRKDLGVVEYPSIRHARENFKTDNPEYASAKNLHFVKSW